jgi:hypothetical protein
MINEANLHWKIVKKEATFKRLLDTLLFLFLGFSIFRRIVETNKVSDRTIEQSNLLWN